MKNVFLSQYLFIAILCAQISSVYKTYLESLFGVIQIIRDTLAVVLNLGSLVAHYFR